ncbi:MAG: type I-E CRISPR-associated protein Cse1/CasA [Candidatus Nanoarchaeia archaeon]|jgi:CRISPR system Cascade subunit CasA|nr:type I-E CRISPR-associated protein Cse1/CasA [Candidatus Nanoarchaeia archaeon]
MNDFNLIEEPWIKVSNHECVSLRQLFTDTSLISLGGNPVEKICVLNLLLGLVQRTCTPKDSNEWINLDIKTIMEKTLKYLENNDDLFSLFGDKPFLQMSIFDISDSKQQHQYKSLQFHTASSESAVVLFQSHQGFKLSNSEKVYLLLQTLGYSFGGKKCGKINDKLKNILGGPALGRQGYLHNFLKGSTILDTIKLNIISLKQIAETGYQCGLGTPPWENMPKTQTCARAENLKQTYIGRLIPLSRFVLLKDDYVFFTEGIIYPTHKEGGIDISISKSTEQVIWTDPEKRPWRQLSSLLGSINAQSNNKKRFECLQLKFGFENIKMSSKTEFGIWSGGIKVSNQTGEQSMKFNDDFVESEIILSSKIFSDSSDWYSKIEEEIKVLDNYSKILFSSISKYFKDFKANGKGIAKQAVNLYWQVCEQNFKELNEICNSNELDSDDFRKKMVKHAYNIYDKYCLAETMRQINLWAKNRPKFYLKKENAK